MYFDTPDEACRAQWQSFNPNAIYQTPTEVEPARFACHWLGKQDGVDTANTILPTDVLLRCPSVDYDRSAMGRCISVYGRRAPCHCETAALASPHAQLIGDPIDLQSGAVTETLTDYATADGQFAVIRQYWSGDRGITTASPSEVPGFGRSWHGLVPGMLLVSGAEYSSFEFLPASPGVVQFFAPAADLASYTITTLAPSRARLSMVTAPSLTRPAFFTAAEDAQSTGEMRMDYPNGDYLLLRRAGVPTSDGKRYLVVTEQHLVSGYTRFFDYSPGMLTPYRVRDSFGRQMQIAWEGARWEPPVGCATPCAAMARNIHPHITDITLPDGTSLHYAYDVARAHANGGGTNDRLVAMQHRATDGTILAARSYLYENTDFPYALTGILDKAGNRINNFAYDQFGLATLTEGAGGAYRFEVANVWLDDSNLRRDVTNPLGLRMQYSYNRNWFSNPGGNQPRHLTRIATTATDTIAAQVQDFSFGSDLLGGITNVRGVRQEMTNDAMGRPTLMREAIFRPEARDINMAWDAVFDLPLSSTQGNIRTEYSYDAQMRLTQMRQVDISNHTIPYATNGQTRSWSYSWNADGRIATVNGPRPINAQGQDDIISFSYDANGNLTQILNGLGQTSLYSGYDANGRPGRMTDNNGVNTDFLYDVRGRMVSMTVRDGTTPANDATTSFAYDDENRVISIQRPATAPISFAYDLAGRLTKVQASSGESINFTYDAMGNVTRQQTLDASGTSRMDITRSFDELGRMLRKTLGVGRTIGFSYDAEGNAIQSVSARNAATNFAFDGLSRLTAIAAPDGGNFTHSYNQNDDETTYRDAALVTTQMVYNGFGQVIQEISPDRGTSIYVYDQAGDLISMTDGRGQQVNYTRDILGRVLTKEPAGLAAQRITYLYDTATIAGSFAVGRLSRITDASGTTNFRYDNRGNMVERRQTIGSNAIFKLTYAYDLADRITSITYPSGRIVYYARDVHGRVSAVSTRATPAAALVTLLSAAQYAPFAELESARFGNNLGFAQPWVDGRRSARSYRRANGSDIWSVSYGYDNDDNIVAINDAVTPANSRSFAYDVVDRLTRVDLPTGPMRREDYVFDANDNRVRVEQRALAGDASPQSSDIYARTPGTNRLTSVTAGAMVRNFTYNARGNLTGEVRPGGVNIGVSYDGYARLVGYTRTGSANLSMGYNGLDQRVRVTTGSVVRRFVQDGSGRMIGEYSTSGARLFSEYIWLLPDVGDGGVMGGGDGTGGWTAIAMVTSNGAGGAKTVHYVLTNHLGVPVGTTNAAGTPTNLPATSSLLGFPGQLRTLPDLYYNQYRDYDPTTGRYIQADPIGLNGDINPYAYARGNPVGRVDPMGLQVASTEPNLPSIYAPPSPSRGEAWTPNPLDYGLPVFEPTPSGVTDWCGSTETRTVPDYYDIRAAGSLRLTRVSLRAACRAHDRCYGSQSCRSRLDCDRQFWVDVRRSCIEQGGAVSPCSALGFLYYQGVRRFAADAYQGSPPTETRPAQRTNQPARRRN